MSFYVDEEIAAQPECWRTAAGLATEVSDRLGADGERIAFVGCGTSWFMGQVLAALREAGGRGESDAFTAAEFPLSRVGRDGGYDRVVALTRSGTYISTADSWKALSIRSTCSLSWPYRRQRIRRRSPTRNGRTICSSAKTRAGRSRNVGCTAPGAGDGSTRSGTPRPTNSFPSKEKRDDEHAAQNHRKHERSAFFL